MKRTVVKVDRDLVEEAMKLKEELGKRDDRFAAMDKSSFISYLLMVGLEEVKKRVGSSSPRFNLPLPPRR